jgi:DNA-binding beta-propeller fold protein YncE
MTLDARARAFAETVQRSAMRVDPVAGLDDLLHRRRRQPLQRAAAAGLALLVMVVAIWAGVVWRGPTPIQPTLGPVTRFRAGPAPVSVAVTPSAAWVLNAGDATISRIDPRTGRVQASFPVYSVTEPTDARFTTAADGRLWVIYRSPDFDGTAISAIDPSTNETLTTFELGGLALQEVSSQGDLAVGSGAVWVALEGDDEVRRLDAATGKLLDRWPLPKPTALAVDGQTLWVATADGRLRSIDIDNGAVAVRPTTELVTRIRVGQGGLWLLTADGKVLRLDRRTGRIVAQVPGSFQAADLAVGAEGVWVYDQHQGAVLRIDPGTNRVVRTIPVISQPLVELYSRVLALGAGAVWVVDKAGETVVRVDPNRPAER